MGLIAKREAQGGWDEADCHIALVVYHLRRAIVKSRVNHGFKTVANWNSVFGHVACQIVGVDNTNGCVKFEQPHSLVVFKKNRCKKERTSLLLGKFQ